MYNSVRNRIREVCPSVLNSILRQVSKEKNQLYRKQNHWNNSSLMTINTGLGFHTRFTHQMHSSPGTILVQARDPSKLSTKIENSIDDRKYDDTWKYLEQHMEMDGFPRKSVMNKVLTGFAESLEVHWLQKAYTLVERVFEETKHNLLENNTLIYLSLALAKRALPVQASTILRKLLETEQYPPVNAWSTVLAHMSRTGQGAYLAAELILEIGYLFHDGRVDPRKKINAPLIAMKPNTNALNVALAGCLLSGTTRKAEQLLNMVPRINVKADPNLLIIMAHIYERNGRREELRKLLRHIDEVCNLTDTQFRQFYNCLFVSHLKFGDLDSASKMVLEMLRKAKVARNALGAATLAFEAVDTTSSRTPVSGQSLVEKVSYSTERTKNLEDRIISYEEFSRDRNFLEAEVKEVLGVLLDKLEAQVELITVERGILRPTETIYVKLVKAFLDAGKMKDLANFLIKAEKEESPVSNDDSIIVHVINACISLGLLDQAHDLLDELRFAGFRVGSSVYSSLVKGYCGANRTKEITSLLRDARRAGVQLDSYCYEALIQSRVVHDDTHGALNIFKEMKEAKIPRGGGGIGIGGHQGFEMLVKGCAANGEVGLMAKLLHEIKEGQNLDCGVHDWNNVVHFFCKKRLMQDAEKALKKMRSLGYSPNAQTFHSMVTGYASVGGNYSEVTELWGEMKSFASATSMKFDQELLDSVLYTFVRGGFFSRANEVIEMMEKGNMFIDKYKYRTLFLKYHKTLYKGKTPKFQTEAQVKKREAALAFKKWVALF